MRGQVLNLAKRQETRPVPFAFSPAGALWLYGIEPIVFYMETLMDQVVQIGQGTLGHR